MHKLVLIALVVFISGIHCDDDLTTVLTKYMLESNVFPSVKNETSARALAVLLQKEFPNYMLAQRNSKPEPKLGAFPCQLTGRSNPRPTNATKLLPGDIDFVAAIGDSIVAAFGALSTSIFTIFTEYRGYSYTVGGQTDFDDMVTVGNIIKLYNPNVKGYSIGNGKADSANAVLNVAVTGARSYNLPDQINMLETKMRNMGVKDDDWKLITLFVGGNDLCDYCSDTAKNSPDNFRSHIETALDSIKARIPNVFVNLVSPPDVTLLGQVSTGFCSLLHAYECGCNSDAGTSAAQKAYTQKLAELVSAPKYQDLAGFHVSLQPFLRDLVLPMKDGAPDRSYFAPDCFHFARKSHVAAGVALWNNMCEEHNKLTTWVPGEPLECPDKYLA